MTTVLGCHDVSWPVTNIFLMSDHCCEKVKATINLRFPYIKHMGKSQRREKLSLRWPTSTKSYSTFTYYIIIQILSDELSLPTMIIFKHISVPSLIHKIVKRLMNFD